MLGYKKLILATIVILLVTSIILLSRPAQAQWTVNVLTDLPAMRQTISQKIKSVIDRAQTALTTQLIDRTLSTFMNKLAYDLANNLATGGPGRTPLFERESFTKSLQTARDAALGEFIGQLSQNSFEDLGFNLCDPSLEVKLSLTLSLIDSKAPPRPTCDWRKVQREWAKFGDNFTADLLKLQLNTKGGAKNLEDFFDKNFGQDETDLGAFAKLSEAARQKEADAIEAKKALTAKCQGYLDNNTPITEEIKTSCLAIQQFQGATFTAIASTERDKISNSASAKEVGMIGQIMKTAGNIFVNTFTSKLMNRWIKDGMWSVFGGQKATNPSLRSSLLAQLRGGANVDKSTSGGLVVDWQKIEPDILESYNIFEEYAVCPEDPQFRTPDNCVISADFLQAISSRLTVQEAIDRGLLNGNWPLIGSDDTLRNANKECYKDGLCYNNLVKLRKANIIPVGWEMAALASPLTKPVTLQEAVNCFEDSLGKCLQEIDQNTGHNPFYHLIDPYWIMKSPPALCNAYVYSPILESPDTSNRQQYCADIKTCLREDAQGNCISGEYGYCTKTENIWRFTGDECQDGDVYSGCLTFQNNNLPAVSYLEQSLDYCTADQVGCKRYSQERNNEGNWVLQDIATDDNDLFLNNKAASCPSDMAGCSEYIVMATDRNINLVANGDFEINQDANTDVPDGFIEAGNGGLTLLRPGEGVGGSTAVSSIYNEASTFVCLENIRLVPNANYTLSADVKQEVTASNPSPSTAAARIVIDNCRDVYGEWGGLTSTDNSMLLENDHNTNQAPYDEANLLWPANQLNTTDFTRISGSFNSGNSVTCENICVGQNRATTENPYLFDNLKLEMATAPKTNNTNFTAYGDGGKINMNGNRTMCTEQEVGCQGYTPSNGDPMIPAVIAQNDLCPSECVGYATFAEAPDGFDRVENPNATYNDFNFIPSTATACPATATGCEEFTNVDAVAQGGEGLEYYTYLRQCVAVDLGEDYITWEGTDVAGYQIRAWKALPSALRYISETTYPSETQGNPPCTNILPGQDTCNDEATTIAACGPSTLSSLDDPNVNANCRQFFDAAGNSFYRLQDRVIFASNDCHDYRRTINSTIYRAIPSQSTQCAANYNGCRAYYGNNANNVRNILTDDFERTVFAPWQSMTAGQTLDLSSESLERNGHSLKIDRTSGVILAPLTTINNNKQYKVSWWMKSSVALGQVHWGLLVSDSAGADAYFPLDNQNDSSLQNIAANNWRYYTVTQYLDIPDGYNLNSARIMFTSAHSASFSENGDIFLDNIIFQEVASNIYAIRNSWSTPVSCDTPYAGYHLGCQSYTDTNRVTYNLKSFQNLCRVEAIGCMAVLDTHNSDNPFAENFHDDPVDNSRLTVPADNITYLVPDNRKYCQAAYQGCQALGLPDRANPDYLPTVYRINDPDQYDSSLCLNDDLYCEEYASDKGDYYFRDPGISTCTYQNNIVVGINVVTGWFKTANLNDPLPLGCLDTDNDYDESDFDLAQNVASCPADKNLCTTFYDPSDPVSCNSIGTCTGCTVEADCLTIANERDCRVAGGTYTAPDCQAYYYYNNEKIDKASCNGQVNKNNGCVLFKEANNWNGDHTTLNVNYDTTKTYDLNVSRAQAVSPVTCNPDCDPALDQNCPCTLDSNVLLKVTKDRQCSEWLACRSSSVVWDKVNNKYKVVCLDTGICTEFDNNNNVTKCAAWSTTEPQALSVANYQDRSTGANDHIQFGDDDYTGYSVPNMLPVPLLTVTNLGTIAEPISRLIYDAGTCSGNGTCQQTIGGDQFTGICHDGRCLVNPLLDSEDIFDVETRGYAAVDAPYPSAISPDGTGLDRLSSYAGANMCALDQVEPIAASPNGCELTYVKTTYGNGGAVLYYPKNVASPSGICSAGNIGANIDCVDSAGFTQNSLCDTYNSDGSSRGDGVCDKKTKAETIVNWPGICLEYDQSVKIVNDVNGTNYCNQWYPVDQIAGSGALYDNYREAGYYEPGSREALFCSVASEFVTTEERVYCTLRGDDNPSHCNALAVVPAGSKISALAISSNSSLISYGYLKPGTYNFVSANAVDHPLNPGFPNGIGLDRIEKANLPADVDFDTSKLTVEDFLLQPNTRIDQVPVVSRTLINSIFDTPPGNIFSPPTGLEISYFYMDEDVNHVPSNTFNGRIWIGDRLDIVNISLTDPIGTVGCATGTNTSDNACDACPAGASWHGVGALLGNNGCNPLRHNYYLKPEVETTGRGMFDRSIPQCGAWGCDVSYVDEGLGATCSGMTCYQQCQVVLDLDPEGDKSWVRTDAWWRNETGSGSAGRAIYEFPAGSTWLSYYYKAGFIQNRNVNYAGISGENVSFSHFGAALGFLGNDVVNVRVPFDASAFSSLSAVTFFASSTGNPAADLITAHDELGYLFRRAYNLRWNTASSTYNPDSDAYQGELVYNNAFSQRNRIAGADYDPVILRVCGSDLCLDPITKQVVSGLTINDLPIGPISAEQSLFASLKFYYYAHPDHMPVKDIRVDWNDGSNVSSAPGKYKNNIPNCEPASTMPGQATPPSHLQGFGGTDRACREAYKTFYHDYQLSDAHLCNGGTINIDGVNYTKPNISGASCYKPAVTVVDQWGLSTTQSYSDWIIVRRPSN